MTWGYKGFLAALWGAFPKRAIEHRDTRFVVKLDEAVELSLLEPWNRRGKPPRLTFPTIPLDGFHLRLDETTSARTKLSASTASSFDAYRCRSNDDALAALWLDVPARAAMSRAVRYRTDYQIDVLETEVHQERVDVRLVSTSEQDLELGVRAGAAMAMRPRRIADELRTMLSPLGMQFDAPAWRMDDDCVGVFTRGAATVLLDWRRSYGLHTRLRAQGPDAHETIDHAWLAPRLDAHGPLVRAAGGELTAERGVVTLTWPGMVRLATALAPAIELLCRLVAPAPAAHPLR